MDESGFASWYAERHGPLLAALVVLCADEDVARESCAEAFARAWERWSWLSTARSPDGWTYRVAVNVVRRRQRRAAMERRLLRRVPEPPPAAVVEPDPQLWAAVRRLTPRQREVVVLRYVLDLTEPAIAEALGVATGTVSAALSAARRRLAAELDAEEWVSDEQA